MSAYRWIDAAHTHVLRIADGANIPADPKNRDFAKINPAEIAAYEAPPAAPVFVTQWQAREALRQAGRLGDVNTFIASLGEEHPAYVAFHYAERFSRASPLIAALKDDLGMTDADLDALFALAKSLSL